jgi:hypothetical protein
MIPSQKDSGAIALLFALLMILIGVEELGVLPFLALIGKIFLAGVGLVLVIFGLLFIKALLTPES